MMPELEFVFLQAIRTGWIHPNINLEDPDDGVVCSKLFPISISSVVGIIEEASNVLYRIYDNLVYSMVVFTGIKEQFSSQELRKSCLLALVN